MTEGTKRSDRGNEGNRRDRRNQGRNEEEKREFSRSKKEIAPDLRISARRIIVAVIGLTPHNRHPSPSGIGVNPPHAFTAVRY